jgi:hypothetical protein
MNICKFNHHFRVGLLGAALLALASTARPADVPVTLKDAFKDHFLVGTAVNRSIEPREDGGRKKDSLPQRE